MFFVLVHTSHVNRDVNHEYNSQHEHAFFELVYILSGTGFQWINNNMFPYHDGHLFMITLGDTYSFSVFGAENIQINKFFKKYRGCKPL
ncbi:hypothetical protein DW083_21390 [Parabacteroides sp. AF48-14]|nr:hypothetical protein DW083_21390 [Parabacteroides sp. AF48-14]